MTPAPTIAAQGDLPSPGLAKGHAKDVVLVGFEPGTSKVKKGVAARSVGATDVEPLSPLAPDTVVMKLPPGQTVEKAIEKLEKQSGVKYAEPDYYVTTAETSDDPYYVDGSLWGMQGDTSMPANLYGSGAAEAWAAGAVGSSSVYVAVIDGGIEIDHPDLIANIWTNSAEALGRPNVDDDRNGRVDDVHGWDFRNNDRSVDDGEAADDHATHVAGTIGARGGNRIGVAGVNWNITIIPVKFIGDNPDGSTTGTFSDAAAAMDYVTALKTRGLNVVATNNSWGCLGCGLSLTMQGAIRRAGDAGIVVVAAAGNSNTDTDITPFYPAGMDCTLTATGIERGWDCLIAVASITGQGARSSFSNYGASSVDLGAPGSEIVSTFRGDYEVLQGTSMATPHVTGAVALCASISPSLGPRARKDLVLTTTTPTSSLSGATSTGGRLDVGAMAQGCGVPTTVPDLTGATEANALDALSGALLVPGTRTTAYHGSVGSGRIIATKPAGGTTVVQLSAVAYVVSKGPISVPDLVGDEATTVSATLLAAELTVGQVTQVFHAGVPVGYVISQTPVAGTPVGPGSAVAYVVSKGPISVPDLVGDEATTVSATLLAAELTVGQVTQVFHAGVPVGYVISQTPVAGTPVGPDQRSPTS